MCAEIEHGPSEGFEMFEGASLESDSPGEKEYIYPWHPIDARIPPSLESAKLALCDLKNLLNPPRNKGHQPKGTGWSVAALQTAQFVGKGPYMARKTVSLAMAQNWMKTCGFRWTTAKNGQYVDGHEREDVVNYRQKKFLPVWYALESKMQKWSSLDPMKLDEGELMLGRRTVVWFHDESTFYAHDCQQKRWVHRDKKSMPQPKGQGVSLMAVDFVSADYGWLRSCNGTQSARILFCTGKARDGYFTNNEIIRHAETALTILEKDYPDDDHVFVFNNASTHLKRADDCYELG
ncbi:hypothetical protein BDR04DRAFT_1118839 [Suillus decipiens]|nr:hypothetical protein BDR04DRAFT_1118839 [Suillus decipiens]